nr:acyl-CoA/acyl-ACP dehydrogenase [Acidimicrobiia bacterium]
MDVTLSEDQQAIGDLAGRILSDKLTPDRLRELDADPDWFARDAWAELARADLLGLCLPEAHGGGGYGVFEACLLLEQVGRSVAPVPLLPTLLLGALPLARFGPATGERDRLLRGVISGDVVLTAAITEAGDALPPAVPATTATPGGDGWRLDGDKVVVPAAHLAAAILVPARTGEGTSTVFLVDPAAAGVARTGQQLTSREPVFDLHLDGVPVGSDDVVGRVDGGAEVTATMGDLAVAGLCAVQAGVCEAALRLTAGYTSERHQFNAPIATFQA